MPSCMTNIIRGGGGVGDIGTDEKREKSWTKILGVVKKFGQNAKKL